MNLVLIAVVALLIGVVLLRKIQHRRQQMGLPNGDVFYQDHRGQPMPSRVLDSRTLGIRGKPDCLIRTSEGIVPVELKKSARPPAGGGVYPNHLIQVLAYIVLVRENYGEQVPYGRVLYGNEVARKVIPTAENLAWLHAVVAELRRARTAQQINRSHQQRGRCCGCELKRGCDQSLDVGNELAALEVCIRYASSSFLLSRVRSSPRSMWFPS